MERSPYTQARANVASEMTKFHGDKDGDEVSIPDVLMQLVGHVDDQVQNESAPDDDYILGGNGVVKALQYCLGEKAQDLRRNSTAVSGAGTPKDRDTAAGNENERKGKAKEMSKNLLDSARKIRARIRPALLKEAATGDDFAYRRLIFLDSTLEKMILRFEDEFPDARLVPAISEPQKASISSSLPLGVVESDPTSTPTGTTTAVSTLLPEASARSDDDDDDDEYDDRPRVAPHARRHNSDVNLASRALGLEEGRIHRLGQGIRRDIMNAPSPTADAHPTGTSGSGTEKQPLGADPTQPASNTTDRTTTSISSTSPPHAPSRIEEATPLSPHLADLARKLENFSGPELRAIVDGEGGGWNVVMERLGANIEELRQMQEADPVGWRQFQESQMKARANVGGDGQGAGV